MKISKKICSVAAICLFTLLISLPVYSQLEGRPDRGYQQGNSYSISDIENINLTGGNVMMNIPLASLPKGRGTGVGYTVSLSYDSKLWNSEQEYQHDGQDEFGNQANYTRSLLQQTDEGGWHIYSAYQINVIDRIGNGNEEPCVQGNFNYEKNSYRIKVEMKMPGGGTVAFRPVGYDDFYKDGFFEVDTNGKVIQSRLTINIEHQPVCSITMIPSNGQGMNYYTTDGSDLRLFIPYSATNESLVTRNWKLTYPDGRIVENKPPDNANVRQRTTDRNGNKIELKSGTYNGMDGTKIEDDLGRFIFFGGDNDNTKIYQTGANNEVLETNIHWKTYWIYRKYRATDLASTITIPASQKEVEFIEDFRFVDLITLPAQASSLTYQFDYHANETEPTAGVSSYTNGWGELSSVTLPSTVKAEYKYDLPESESTLSNALNIVGNKITRKDLTYEETYNGQTTQKTDTWLYSIFPAYGQITAPDGSISYQSRYYKDSNINKPSSATDWRSGLVYSVKNPYGSVIEKIWEQKGSSAQAQGQAINPYVKTEFTSIPDSTGSLALTAIKDYVYDQNSNVLEVREYDWVAYASVPRSNYNPTGIPAGAILKRKTVNTYYYPTEAMSSSNYNSNYYANPASPALLNLIKSSEIQNGSGTAVSRSEFIYDNSPTAPTKGNVTETRTWDSTKAATLGSADANGFRLNSSNSVSTTAVYDQYGNLTLATDAKGNQTQITYGDIVTPTGTVSGLYPTQTTAAYGTAIAQTATAEYDFNTGLVKSSTTLGNTSSENVTNAVEYDALGRPIKSKAAVGTPLEIWTQTEYDDVLRRVIVKADIETKGDGKKVAIQHYDELSRVRLTRTLENPATEDATNEQDGIKVETRYRTSEPYSYTLISNPFRAATATAATSEPSMGWTRSKSINTGKHSETETFSGAALPAPWGTNANSTGKVQTDVDADRTLVTDQSGKQRISKSNALGQLESVWEITAADSNTEAVTFGALSLHGLKTGYDYDTLSNLKIVNQGEQVRIFTYSSLSRLLSAQNPESGVFNYQYDYNGNVVQKTDSRGVITAYSYDALNRINSRSYSNEPSNQQPTPPVTYTYDNLPNAKGKLTKIYSSVSTTEFTSFDILGRALTHKQMTDGQIYTTENIYNLAGALVEQVYPSGRRVKTTLDADGDLAKVESKRSASDYYRNYATNFVYTAAGAISSLRLGNGKFENTLYNSRLQPVQIGLGSSATNQNLLKLNFDYGMSDNNENVKAQTITVPSIGNVPGFVALQTYSYDSLNRLKQAQETINNNQTANWKQTFTYDRYGNRRFDEANTTTLAQNCPTAVCNPSVDPATNKLVGYTFDNAGNTKVDAENRTFIYDGENKQIEVKDQYGTSVGKYYYDGDGKRVKKISLTETTLFIYNAAGQLVAEYSTNISQQAQVSYTTMDHLGSPRISTNALGEVISRHDYQPFGEEIQRSNYGADEIRKKFTSYERDTETNLDFAQARMYANNLGRFSSTDPLLNTGRPDAPQSWNRFSYVMNNPLIFIDPTGMYLCTAGKTNCEKFETSLQEARTNLEKIKDKYGEDSDKYKDAKAAVDVYGNKDEDNGVTIALAGKKSNLPPDAAAETDVKRTKKQKTDLNPEGKSIVLTFAQKAFDSNQLTNLVVHEGSHAADGAAWVGCNFCSDKNPTIYQTEFKAFLVSASFSQAMGIKTWVDYDSTQPKGQPRAFGLFQIWNPSWKSVDESKPQINFFLKRSKLYNRRLNRKSF